VLEERAPRRVNDLHPGLMARPGDQDAGVTALLAPLLYRGRALGVLVALDPLGRDAGFSDEDESVLVSFAASAATAVATAQSVAEDRTRETIAATERERGRWARELHDESLQSLAGLRVLLSAARRAEPSELDDLLVQGIEQIDSAIAEMRRLIADLRPSALDQLGLGAALEALGERTGSGAGIEVEIDLDLDFEAGRSESRLLGAVEDTAYRLVQEALNNAVQHGEANSVRVEVAEEDGSLRLRVSDDGKGFDPSAQTDGFGLIGMRERAELAGGNLELRSTPGDGTTIGAIIPTAYRHPPGAADAA
jgi:signal transduction histidine kinase